MRVIACAARRTIALTDPAVIERYALFVTMPVRALKSKVLDALGFHRSEARKNVLRKKLGETIHVHDPTPKSWKSA
ncbi:hypothetical protein KCP73_13495 [Salmonella enterica subsp. enterica]|nr:hypothetical protein KCP73_13495 [Salmonella enterica subsp. enterica]